MRSIITVKHKGSFNKTEQWFNRMLRRDYLNVADKYGQIGVQALRDATPVDSGITAESWFYEIENTGKSVNISFHNNNENQGANIVILLMYGHGTGNGGYVQANDFVNPALEPVFQQMADAAWKEVTK